MQKESITSRERLRMRKYICAGCERTPVNILVRLACDNSTKVRRRVAENPKTPITVLVMLASDRDKDVRVGVCDNWSTPAGLLFLLAGEDCADVRYAIADNSHVPRQILTVLARDENPYVAERAMRTMARQVSIDCPRAA